MMMAKACKEKSFHRFKEQALEAPEPTDSNWNLIIPQRQSERIVSVCDGLVEKLASFFHEVNFSIISLRHAVRWSSNFQFFTIVFSLFFPT